MINLDQVVVIIDESPKPDNRMVRCVLRGYASCPALVPEACICYQMQRTPVPGDARNMYEEAYLAKYGRDEQ